MRINFHNMCNVAQNEFLNAYTYHASKRFVSNADCKERLFFFFCHSWRKLLWGYLVQISSQGIEFYIKIRFHARETQRYELYVIILLHDLTQMNIYFQCA